MKELLLEHVFSKEELKIRGWCITTLVDFGKGSVEAAKAIALIRDKKLYRPHSTLKEFCQRECGWTDRRLRQITTFLEIKAALPPKVEPLVQNERQARELQGVPKDKLTEVFDEVEGKPTAKKIRAAVHRVCEPEPPKDDMGFPIPFGQTQDNWNRKEGIEEILLSLQRTRNIVGQIQTDDPLWSVIHPNGVIHDLESAISRIQGGMPAYVCVYCDGEKPKSCQVCKGVGLISKFMWKNTPLEKRQKREEQCQ